MRKKKRRIRVVKCKRKRIYGDSHTFLVEMRITRGRARVGCAIAGRERCNFLRPGIQICMRVYGKQYDNKVTYFCISFKLLIAMVLFLILHGIKRAMKRSARGSGVWGQA